MSNWITSKEYQGVQYRLNENKIINGRPERIFRIRYNWNGEGKVEGLGCLSDGMNEARAGEIIKQLKYNQTMKTPPFTYKEMKSLEVNQAIEVEVVENLSETLKLNNFFHNHYIPYQRDNKKKKPNTIRTELSMYKVWIENYFGGKSIYDITPKEIDAMKEKMGNEGRSASTIKSTLLLFSQIYDYATKHHNFTGRKPIGKDSPVELPKVKNEKLSYLTKEKAKLLLDTLKRRSQITYEIALIALHTGGRKHEVLTICWEDVDLENELITLKETKNGNPRSIPMSNALKDFFSSKTRGENQTTVITNKDGESLNDISKTYYRTIKDLKFNEGVSKTYMIDFHTLRHTFASFLLQQGESIHILQKLLGHSDLKLTMRYSKFCQSMFDGMKGRMDTMPS